ncbi:hypothetical protein PGT21_011414 [Puccinia graminis f. sp. tritici]|uniref:Uncharacterized protein n=1 Tax=Puccinia graminis f. sp. tritici TaxID=56615 RepID=A0A5B0PXA6_PUCGR|nr:hypothetical protein PGT21_011414 [Puccinia graminis f. sp. tritici]KAA1127750.1 hypothetical protein PGTUg99_001818 [Puccinia graminis f. sp. tritici]
MSLSNNNPTVPLSLRTIPTDHRSKKSTQPREAGEAQQKAFDDSGIRTHARRPPDYRQDVPGTSLRRRLRPLGHVAMTS